MTESRSILYKDNYVLSDFFTFSIVEMPKKVTFNNISQEWEEAFLIETNVNGTTIKIVPSYRVYYNEGKYTPAVNGANYYYNNNGYQAFASLEAVSIYMSNYCFQSGTFDKKHFDLLFPECILIFSETGDIDSPSLDMYIGTKKELEL